MRFAGDLLAHGFVLGFSEDDSSKLVPLLVVKEGYILFVCFVEFRVNILEYVAAVTVMPVMMLLCRGHACARQ
jgi:hypothetical protein